MEPETSQRLCGDDAMFERKGDIVLPRNKHSFVLQLVLFYTSETYVSVAISNRWLEDAAYWHADCIVDGEFLAADVE